MLTPFDDYPIHQTPLPVAHPASGDPNHYDRFWFNGYTEDFYFAAGMAVYPNRGIIDGAFAVVHDGVQRSVFASGRIPQDRSQTRIGPLTIDVVEPLRVTRVRADAADLGIDADVTFTARTVALEEPRQTITAGTKSVMDSTRLTQWGTWSGRIVAGGAEIPIDRVYGTKDRSWGVRPVGEPTPSAPETTLPQIFFLWAPINWSDCCTHFLCFERANGDRFVGSQAVLQIVGEQDPTWGLDATRVVSSIWRGPSPMCAGRAACGVRRARRCACCATTAPTSASSSSRCSRSGSAASATPIPSGATRAGTARRRSGPRSTRSTSSTTSNRGTSTSSR